MAAALKESVRDWMRQTFAWDFGEKARISRAALATSMGLNPEQYARPYPGSPPSTVTIVMNDGVEKSEKSEKQQAAPVTPAPSVGALQPQARESLPSVRPAPVQAPPWTGPVVKGLATLAAGAGIGAGALFLGGNRPTEGKPATPVQEYQIQYRIDGGPWKNVEQSK